MKPDLPSGPISATELMRLKEQVLRNDPGYRAKFEAERHLPGLSSTRATTSPGWPTAFCPSSSTS